MISHYHCHGQIQINLFVIIWMTRIYSTKTRLRIKSFLRDYLTSKTAIDYTKEPKYAFVYDFKAFVKDNISFVTDVILTNDLIDKT